MWDVLRAVIAVLEVVAHPRFYVGLATGAAIGWMLMQLAPETGVLFLVLFGLTGAAGGAIWDWRHDRDE